ncbi:hypothetical protein EMCRGX_G005663 [Ephydatia muelleri]
MKKYGLTLSCVFVLKYRYDVRRWEGVKRIDEGIILRRGWDSGRWKTRHCWRRNCFIVMFFDVLYSLIEDGQGTSIFEPSESRLLTVNSSVGSWQLVDITITTFLSSQAEATNAPF